MKFTELLYAAMERSEVPLRFEPGADEAMGKPIIETLQAWIQAHLPDGPSDFDAGARALATQLLAELDGSANLPE